MATSITPSVRSASTTALTTAGGAVSADLIPGTLAVLGFYLDLSHGRRHATFAMLVMLPLALVAGGAAYLSASLR